ncbi:hypothetical protein R69927_07817 [Paraburkholderia domus]|nr:hypothetical protein R69927_07817 [Paraburkholderia domus]
MSRAIRHDTTMYSASAFSTRSICESCSASTRQAFFRTLKNISISHLARYQSMSSMSASASPASRLVTRRQMTGFTPAGASTSYASTQVSVTLTRPGSVMRWLRSSCFTSRAFWPLRPGSTKLIRPSTLPACTLSHSFSSSFKARLCCERISQSAGSPNSCARCMSAAMSPSRSATYTSRASGRARACSATIS